MTAQRLTSIIVGTLKGSRAPRDGLRAAKPRYAHAIITLAIALAGAGLACGDDKPDATSTGGRGGSTGGAGGRGGTGGTAGRGGAGGTGGSAATGGSAGTAGSGTGGSGSDASGTGGTAGTGATGGTGGTGGGSDAGTDMALPADMAVDQPVAVDLPVVPPDTAPTNTVQVSDCAQLMCPQLTSVASQCSGDDSDCERAEPSATTRNYCHDNGVKKLSTTASTGGAGYLTTMRVKKSNGQDCYTLEMAGTPTTNESWTYKSPSGTELARGTWERATGRLTITCDTVNYVIGDVACPGTDGEPDNVECPVGQCSP